MVLDSFCIRRPLIFRHALTKVNAGCGFRPLSTQTEKEGSSNDADFIEAQSVDDSELQAVDPQLVASNEKYAKIKDISRMKDWHRCLLHGQITPPNEFKWQQERWALKERYAKYGRASGVNPGVMWPTEEELNEKILEEGQWTPKLAETILAYKNKLAAEKEVREKRLETIDANLKKYPNKMKEYLKTIEERRKAIKEAKEQREARLKEIRDSFGYAISESDPRFRVRLMMKREEEKTASSIVRKKQRQAEMLEKLQSMTALLASQTSASSAADNGNDYDSTNPVKST